MNIVTYLGLVIKRLSGVNDISLLKKNIHKRIGQLIFHKKYTSLDLVDLMKSMGMKNGSVVCIHSSMKEFYNYKGTATDLINEILKCIGSEGTLVMPAFVSYSMRTQDGYIFDKDKDKTGAGYLAETFRKYPDVCRSINVRHSVCAIGKYADFFTRDHYKCHDCWDKDSPWQRMMGKDALVFNLGLPRSYMGTFHHCVESRLQYEHPYWKQFFNVMNTYKYYSHDGKVLQYSQLDSQLERRTREKNIFKYFTSEDWQIRKISNLEVKVFYTAHCFPKMLELGRRGISVYYVPSPKKYEFRDK